MLYWNNKGKQQGLYNALNKLIPDSGKCYAATTMNKELERLRKMANAYYDLLNNGGCNRARAIAAYTGCSVRYNTVEFIADVFDELLDKQIEQAAIEQLSLGTLEVAA